MKFSAIIAISTNNIIGNRNFIPWKLSTDLKRFKALTTNKKVVMGAITYESLPKKLEGRELIVLSRTKSYPDVGIIRNINTIKSWHTGSGEELFIAGGSTIYYQLLNFFDKIYLTLVKCNIEGDVEFDLSRFSSDDWVITHTEVVLKDSKNEYDSNFMILERKKWNQNL